ncbi:MAG: HYR domain-containing protein, partial [Saprospiraceae bacterium]|nr:HYR domain-containing protein [Saprospiraceae bacterium]
DTTINNAIEPFGLGSTDVIWTVTDEAGNSLSCVQVITVEDLELPMITCPADQTVETDMGQCSATGVDLGMPTILDNCVIDTTINNAVEPFGLGSTDVIWTVTDEAGNSLSCVQVISVEDLELPMITCPADQTVETDMGQCSATGVDLGMPTILDNCVIDTTINNAIEPFGLGSTDVIWTVTDEAGNSLSCVQVITVEDLELPMITCPADQTVETDMGQCSATGVDLGMPTILDNCVIDTTINNAVEPFGLGSTDVIWTVTDQAGNSLTCVQVITVEDNENPTITCPMNIVVSTDAGVCEATGVNLGTPVTEDNCVIDTTTNNGIEPFDLGDTDVIWTVTDSSGNTATCIMTVTVVEDEDPMITCPTDLTVSTDDDECHATNVVLGIAVVSDNCTIDTISYDAVEPYGLGDTNVIWTVTDAAGNTGSCIQTITVNDNQPPVITCPSDITVMANLGMCEAIGINLGLPTATDNCGVQSTEADLMEPLASGTTSVTWTATDDAGNTATCSQNILVSEDQPPSITCPDDLTVNTDVDLCSASNVALGNPTTSDNCGVSSVSNDSSEPYPLGITEIVWTASDPTGNTSSCTQILTVVDVEVPSISCPADLTVSTDTGVCEATNVDLGTPTTSDNCMIDTTLNDAIEPYGLGNTDIIWTTTDNSGNTNTCSQTITVEDNEDPTIVCPSDLTVETDSGVCQASDVDLGSPEINDNCSIDSIYNDPVEPYFLGDTDIVWTVLDGSGNTATCKHTITVVDNENPMITCPPDQTVSTDLGTCVATGVILGTPSTSDNCQLDTLINNASDQFVLGDTEVIWIVTDHVGNSNSCTQVVTVEDNEVPLITCPDNLTIDSNAPMCTAENIDLGIPQVSDNCGIDTTFNNSGLIYTEGINIVTWQVIDQSGNTASCDQEVFVNECVQAIDDCVTIFMDETTEIFILNNDLNLPDEGTISIDDPNHGIYTVANNIIDLPLENQYLIYTPNNGFAGVDTFNYTVCDNIGNCSTAQIKVIVLFTDAALVKREVSDGPYKYGDQVDFEIEVYNQGQITIQDIELVEYLACGHKFLPDENSNWTFDPIFERAYTVLNDSILPGESITIPFSVELSACSNFYDWENGVEIVSYKDTLGTYIQDKDIDSQADDIEGNDLVNDDVNDNSGGDEDDHDIESIDVFDLALYKELLTLPIYIVGDVLEFRITVVNQGNVPATNIVVGDYLPPGYEFRNILNPGWSQDNTPIYTYTISDILNPGDSISITMNTIIGLVELENSNYTNISEIVSADAIGINHSIDADSDPDMDLFNEENIVDNAINNKDDEDDHDIEMIDVLEEFDPCDDDCNIECNALINVSLDENCMAEITPAMGAIGIHEICNSFYDIILFDENGELLPGATVDISHVGQLITYRITEPLCMNSCEGQALIEYKLPPVIECTNDVTVACFGLELIPTPTATVVCGDVEVILVNEVIETMDCDPQYTSLVTRTFRATDSFGNTSECSSTVTIERINLNDIIIPDSKLVINDNAVGCNADSLEYNLDGIPLPWTTEPGKVGTGVPVLCDDDIINGVYCLLSDDFSGIPLIPGATDLPCNVLVSYTDVELPSNSCVRTILRTWEIREWWCSGENTNGGIQRIEIIDNRAPEFMCPDDFTVSAGEDCISEVVMPQVSATDNCSTINNTHLDYESGFSTDITNPIELDLGVNVITYIVSDACYNSSSCQVNVTVEDNLEPVAICEPFTAVSLDATGQAIVNASTFDDGSWDNCAIDSMLVRRMDNVCTDVDTVFKEYVNFCCADILEEVMVVFKVVDTYGNKNICMVSVEVQDKLPASVTCLADTTIDCRVNYDIENLAIQFGWPEIDDNCSGQTLIHQTTLDNTNACGIGEIIRIFEIEENGNIINSCEQLISVVNQIPFVESNIQWPFDYASTDACSADALNPDNLPVGFAYPLFTNDDECSLVGFDYQDNIISSGVTGGTCITIERTWTVINWCSETNGSFDQFVIPQPQILTLTNNIAPVIDMPDSLLIESEYFDCSSGEIIIEANATDDCSTKLSWNFIVRNELDSIILIGNEAILQDTFKTGYYSVEWHVNDNCGNKDTLVQALELRNTKSPQPICLNGLVVSLVPVDLDNDGVLDAEQLNISVDDIDGGTYHTCNNGFVLSFTPDMMTTDSIFNCDHLGIQALQLWATDTLTGAQDYCTATIEIQDNNNVAICDSLNMASIRGTIYTEDIQTIERVIMDIGIDNVYDSTDIYGEYAFDQMPIGGSYDVTPYKNDDPLNGVTTLDLLIMQKHILALERLNSPYKILAADIDRSGDVTARDLVELRKLILGIYTEYPQNQSWRFVDAEHEFIDPQNPWLEAIPESYNINQLLSDMDIEFIGAKVGDVTGDAIPNSDMISRSISAGRSLTFNIENVSVKKGALVNIPVSSSNYMNIGGWQGTIEFDPNLFDIVGIESNSIIIDQGENFNLEQQNKGWITVSYNDTEYVDKASDDILFTIQVKALNDFSTEQAFKFSSNITPAQAYFNGEIINLEFNNTDADPTGIQTIHPNPWIEKTHVDFNMDKTGSVEWSIYDAGGTLVTKFNREYNAGKQYLLLDRSLLTENGVYYITMKTADLVSQSKMIILD